MEELLQKIKDLSFDERVSLFSKISDYDELYELAPSTSIISNSHDIYWDYNGEKEFDKGQALAALIANDVVFLGDFSFELGYPSEVTPLICVLVNCNDIFFWGTADCERLPLNGIKDLYDMWYENPSWGAAKWCALKRGMMPQYMVEQKMREAGVWDHRLERLEAR